MPVLAANSILIPGLILGGALLLGALVVAVVQRWRKLNRPLGPTASEQLAHFRSLYEQGAISEEEFHRLRAVLAGEIRRSLQMPENQPAPEAPRRTNEPPANAPRVDSQGSDPGGFRPA
jgi:hypothetical protein